jgi:GT2 family glycosyltransferase
LYAEFFDGHFIGSNEDYYESYKVNEFLTGWCYVMKKRVFELIYPWDEQFDLYYQDNDYAEKIKMLGIKHALVRDSIVSHLGSKTVGVPSNRKFDEDELKFRKKWNKWD